MLTVNFEILQTKFLIFFSQQIGDLQSRSDQDVDVFVLHGITPSTSTSPTTSTKQSSTTKTTIKYLPSTSSTMSSPKASDILSKLISVMPPARNPKNFVVFAPIPEAENSENQRKGRRLDRKVVFRDGDDLVAEESIISEDKSQELGSEKINFNRKRKPTVDNPPLKLDMAIPPHRIINQKGNPLRNPRILQENASEAPPNFIKRPQQADFVAFPPNPKLTVNSISNRNGGNTVPNINFQRNNFPSPQQNTLFQKSIKMDQQSYRGPHKSYENTQTVNSNQNYPSSGFQSSASSSFNNKENPPQFQMTGPAGIQNKENNIPFQRYQRENQRSPSIQMQQNIEPPQGQFLPVQGSPQPNYLNSPQNIFSHDNSPPGASYSNVPQKTFSVDNPPQGPSFSNSPQKTFPGGNPPIGSSFSNSPQKTFSVDNPPIGPSFSNSPQNTFSPESAPMASGGPQYFAPPPQTFHTKINYDHPPSTFSSSPSAKTSYEKVAQSSVDTAATDGGHHHHHHHHHHEPVPSNSDPIGDVNYSDVPRANDADRLGSIGIGLGPSRGITLQIGGGGLGGLLPLGTLGIARSIVSALLPRPSLGLNSKIFMGVEVGKGGGFSIG